MNKHKVSVIIPTYNRIDFVSCAIQSVLDQSFPNIELIIIDDGSTDGTYEYISPFLDKMIYFYTNNKGAASARNLGVKLSTGKWISFLDSDDCFHTNKTDLQLNFMLKNNLNVSFTDVITYSDAPFNGNYKNETITNYQSEIYDEPFDILLDSNSIPKLSSLIIEKGVFLENGGFDENLTVSEDTKLYHQLAFSNKFGIVKQNLVFFNRNENRNGLINQNYFRIKELNENHINILQNTYYKRINKDDKINRRLKSMLCHLLSMKSLHLCIDQKFRESREASLKAIKFGGDYRGLRRAIFSFIFPKITGSYGRRKYHIYNDN